MSNLRKLGAVVVLTCALGVSSFAGETQSPPCGTDPGEIHTGPCSSAQPITDPTDPGQTDTPPAADTVDVISIAEAALTALLLF